MKIQKIYKVVRSSGGKLVSAFVGGKEGSFYFTGPKHFTREYAIGKVTRPYEGTKLFAFTDLSQAKSYANTCYGFVYEAVGTNVEKRSIWIDGYVDKPELIQSIFKKKTVWKIHPNFSSAVACDTIMLVKGI